MSLEFPDISESLNLTRDGRPRCWNFEGKIEDYIDHVRARVPADKEMAFNCILSEVLDRGLLRLDRFKEMVKSSSGTCTWDCCQKPVQWRFDNLEIQDYMAPSSISDRTKNSKECRALMKFPWLEVKHALERAHGQRLKSNSQGCARGKLTHTDFRRALKIVEAQATSSTPRSQASVLDESTQHEPDHLAVATSAADAPRPEDPTGGRQTSHNSPAILLEPQNRPTPTVENNRAAHFPSASQAPSPRRTRSERRHSPDAIRVEVMTDSPNPEVSSDAHRISRDSSPAPAEPPTKRMRKGAAAAASGSLPPPPGTSLEGLVRGRLLGADFVFGAMRCICECTQDFFAAEPGHKITYASQCDAATRLVPIQESVDHWILGQVRQGHATILYDPRGSCDSVAGVELVRTMVGNNDEIRRSSPLFQYQEGDSEVLLLYMALCLMGRDHIPSTVNRRRQRLIKIPFSREAGVPALSRQFNAFSIHQWM
ncbi:hypothetical protein HIM_12130 [Hirsutella minnesotensis 3608]|uniref:Uncharacterized protein n=1 Tax=Hirsutella minnesotensis 3608 TaxID=1043627 RepID=A0A0F7ZQU6_9HYPO|nr:hypothetical protein HIM_12130 [Hirsutella minnesotensis 3608]